jgi:hypothetical protein
MKARVVSIYNDLVRPRLPATADTKAVEGIEVVSRRYRRHRLDTIVPIPTPYELYLKERNIELIREAVNVTDTGISIGGGYGVTAIALSERVDTLHIFEGSTDLIGEVEKNLTANNVDAQLHETIVGEAIAIDGRTTSSTISPSDLPDAGVIEMDCEGSEISILDGITKPPDQFVIETHPTLGAPTEEVVSRLHDLGHTVTSQAEDPVDGDILVSTQ